MKQPLIEDISPLSPLIFVPILILIAVNVWHHALWGDELHAWGLTLASPHLVDLFLNLRYEGHPGLWHLLLWCASSVSASPVTMQLVHIVITTGIILLIAVSAPFSRLEKALLLLNYYLVYEYTVIARNYGLALLLAMIYSRVRAEARDRPIVVGILLGAMGNTNVYAFALSGMLGLEYAWNGMIATRRFANVGYARVILGGSIYCALMLFCAATVWPPADISHHSQQPIGAQLHDAGRFGLQLLRTAVAPFFPVDLSFPASFAFPGNIYENGKRVWLSLALLPVIVIALGITFRRQPRFLLVIGGTALIAAGFSFAVYPSAIRHMGVVFTAFVALLWVIRAESRVRLMPASRRWNPESIAVLRLLAMGALGGGFALAGQWMRPFAVNDAVVRWLAAHEAPDMALVGFPDMRVEPVAVLMHRRFYALDCRCEDSYVRFLNRRDGFTEAMVPERLEEAVRLYYPRPVVLLTGDPLAEETRTAIRARGLALTERIHLTGAERDKEMTIFEVARR